MREMVAGGATDDTLAMLGGGVETRHMVDYIWRITDGRRFERQSGAAVKLFVKGGVEFDAR